MLSVRTETTALRFISEAFLYCTVYNVHMLYVICYCVHCIDFLRSLLVDVDQFLQ